MIGPIDVLATIAGKHGKSPYLWRRGSKWRDEGDLPSAREMRTFLDHAATNNIPLTAEMLIRGAAEDEITALLADRTDVAPHAEAAE